MGLSATIHFLNRLRLEDKPGADPAIAVEQATILVGPALILTSVVLACGLAVMVFSDLPSLRLFGWLSAFAMLAALTADLLILRPTAMYLNQLARRFGRIAAGRQSAGHRSQLCQRALGHRDRDFGDFAAGRPDRRRSDELPLDAIDSVALKPTALAVAWMLLAVALPDSEPTTPRVVSFHEPEMLPPSLVMSLASSNL